MKINRSATIYLIRNTVNNKIYIGSTINKIKTRWNEHIGDLNRGTHNKNFINDWKNSLENQWQFTIVEENVPVDLRYIVEFYWINKLDSCNENKGYNLSKNQTVLMPRRIFDKPEQIVENIVMDIRNRVTYRDIAMKYKVSLGSIGRIRSLIMPEWGFKNNFIAKLEDKTLKEIKKLLADGKLKQCEIASKFNMTEVEIFEIKKRFFSQKIRKRITEDIKNEIIKMSSEMTYREIREKTGVSLGSICKILEGKLNKN